MIQFKHIKSYSTLVRGLVSIISLSYFSFNCSSCLLDFGLIFSFSLVFLITYPTHMYIVEVYLATVETHFAFMAFKYCFGCLHLVLLPVFILLIKRDIRQAAVDVYCKRASTQQENKDMTFEQLQQHVGIGVNPGN